MRASRLVLALFLLATTLALAAWSQSPSGRRVTGGGSTPPSASSRFDPAQSAGLFVGINTFDDRSFNPLYCSYDDMVDQAYLFSMELGLIKPEKITLILSGTNLKNETRQKLDELENAQPRGATVIRRATREQIEANAIRVAEEAGENGLLIISVCSHGYKHRGNDYIVTSNSTRDDTITLVSVGWLLHDVMDELGPPRAIAFIEACRERQPLARGLNIPAPSSSVSARNMGNSRGSVSERLGQALMQCQHQRVIFQAAASGAQAFEDRNLGNGIFTSALLAALRGSAADASGEDGLLSDDELFRNVESTVRKWLQDMADKDPVWAHKEGINPNTLRKVVEWRRLNPDATLPLVELATASRAAPVVTPEPTRRPTPAPTLSPPPRLTEAPRNEPQPKEVRNLDLGGGVKMRVVWVPAGTFTMGSPTSEEGRDSDEGPQTRVTLDGFWMGETEVTQAQWQAVMRNNPSWFNRERVGGDPSNHPVENVSWEDAKDFCDQLSSRTGYRIGLPTEAQWEYACRAGSTTSYCFGGGASRLGDYAWFDGNSNSQTHPVRQKQPNAWGLYDIHGNVWEWCADWKDTYPGGNKTNYLGPSNGSDRVIRGGSWYVVPRLLRSAGRVWGAPSVADSSLGFRVAVSPSRP
jgi:formylglycine-generating enzyme required for sulfatase activity